jgi:hypothetical protein
MFAILIFEREPLRWDELPGAIASWVQTVGGFAAVGLTIWCLVYLLRLILPGFRLQVYGVPVDQDHLGTGPQQWTPKARLFLAAVIATALAYGLFFGALLVQEPLPPEVIKHYQKQTTVSKYTDEQQTLLTVAGAFALAAACLPFVWDLAAGRFRFRRIWAVARLRMKEAVRRKILWVFSLLVLVFMFAGWFLDTGKPEFQLRNYIWVVDWSMTVLLLLAASLVAAFSIHTDVKSQTIHTVVTKPVERFEIVLGTFLGYLLLMTGVLVVMTGLCLLYVARGINQEAAEENYKARVPIYGELKFKNTPGEDVGREWTHRKYISGPNRLQEGPPHYAVWTFDHLPARLADLSGGVPCEFSFDIYRTHKGTREGQGVLCTFLVVNRKCPLADVDGRLQPANLAKIEEAQRALSDPKLGKTAEEINEALAERFGYFRLPSVNLKDYHTQKIILPAVLFKDLPPAEEAAKEAPFGAGAGGETDSHNQAALQVVIQVNEKDETSRAQLVGVAKYDLYLLDHEKYFEWNFFKASFGLWCRLALIIGLAVIFSTYLSGIISWFATMVLFGLGLVISDIKLMALGLSEGGGPLESSIRIFNRTGMAVPLEETPTTQVARFGDEVYRFFLNFFIKLVPDVNRFDLSRYVANGFDISGTSILLLNNLVPLIAYLFLGFVLAFYLMKSREVANPS